MQIIEDINDSHYQIQAYKPGEVTINKKKYRKSLVVTRDTLITDWGPQSVYDVTQTHIAQVLALKPDTVLFGTGEHFRMLPKTLQQFDSMTTDAACRTFVALSSEGRNVAAILLIESLLDSNRKTGK